MSDTEDTPASPELLAEVDRLNEKFWVASIHHAGCDHDTVLIRLFGTLLAIARLNGEHSLMALATLRDVVEEAERAGR